MAQITTRPQHKALPFGLISLSLPLASDISGSAAAGGRHCVLTSPAVRRSRGAEGGGRAAGYVVIWAVISTAILGRAGGGDERSDRRWRGGAAGVQGLEGQQCERNAPPLSISVPLCLSPSPSFFGACVVWICAFLKWRLKLTVSFSLGTRTRLTCVVCRCSNSLVELGEFGWSLLAQKKMISQISHLFYDFVPQNVGSGTG